MKFAMCNEFCEGWSLDDALRLARDVGYYGVEVAPFTVADSVEQVSAGERERLRGLAAELGVQIIGLHWLLVKPEGLYMNHPDAGIRGRTVSYMQALVHFCADLGGDRMVIGSPLQRKVVPGFSREGAWDLAVDTFLRVLEPARERGVTLCIEPLSTAETDFITSVEQGMQMVRQIADPHFRVHLDVKAMCAEGRPLDEIIRGARGQVGHLHVNDANRNGPGWGDTDYGPIVRALREIGYDDIASVEVFDFSHGAEPIARRSLEFLERAFAAE